MSERGEGVYPDRPFVSRTVAIGGRSKSELVRDLRERSIRLNDSAERLFADDRFVTERARRLLPTVELTVENLGYPQGATTEEINVRAHQVGLQPCPRELGPCLRLAYLDQPEGSFGAPVRQHKAPLGSVTIASEPLDEDPSTPSGFYLRRIDSELWLRGYHSERTFLWDPGDHLVFQSSRADSGE